MSSFTEPMSPRERILRLLAILVVVPAIAAFGIWRVGGFPRLEGLFATHSGSVAVPPTLHPGLDGTAVGEPMLSSVGGRRVRTQIYVAPRVPSAVIDRYARHFQEANFIREVVEKAPSQSEAGRFGRWMAENNPQSFRFDSAYCSVIGARDPSGRDVGVVAFPSPKGEGAVYYVMEAH